MIVVISKCWPENKKLITLTKTTDRAPQNGPINMPVVGPKKSNKENFWFEPTMLVKGIARAIRPRIVKMTKNKDFLRIFFLPTVARLRACRGGERRRVLINN